MRTRNIKEGFFLNEELADCNPLARILFAGLWCYADREGRFEWRPKKIKAQILPYDDCDVSSLLTELKAKKLIFSYSANGNSYGIIPKFLNHQNPHPHEPQSILPKPPLQVTRCKTTNQDKDKDKDKDKERKKTLHVTAVAKKVIDYLNEVSGRRFTYSDSHLKFVRARLDEGFTEEDCRQVIDKKWKDPNFKEEYFRPKTLFNSENFEGYLYQGRGKRKTKNALERFQERHRED